MSSPRGKEALFVILTSLANKLAFEGLETSELRELSKRVLESDDDRVRDALDYVKTRGVKFPREQRFLDDFVARVSRKLMGSK